MAGKFSSRTSGNVWSIGAAIACVAMATAADSNPKPINIDSHSAIEDQAPLDKQMLAANSPAPSAGSRVFFASSDKSVRIGVWESGAGTLKLDMPVAEYIHVVEGKTVIRDFAGNAWTYKAGDSFVLLPGFKGTAEIVGHFKKEFVDVKLAQ